MKECSVWSSRVAVEQLGCVDAPRYTIDSLDILPVTLRQLAGRTTHCDTGT